MLNELKIKVRRKDKSVFEDLPQLQHEIADIMLLTFESASGEDTNNIESERR